jgi:hypothetical protein
LFLLADLIAGAPVFSSTGVLNSWLASLGVALTAVFAFGVLARSLRCRVRLGPDSILAPRCLRAGSRGAVRTALERYPSIGRRIAGAAIAGALDGLGYIHDLLVPGPHRLAAVFAVVGP